MNMGLPLPFAVFLVLLGITCSYAKQIKYIVTSAGSYQNNPPFLPDKWHREIHSIAQNSVNSIPQTTEATYQNCEQDGSCSDLQVDSFGGSEGTFKPFPQDHLEKILQKFNKGATKLANLYIDRSDTIDQTQQQNDQNQQQIQAPQQQDPGQLNDKSKSWNLVNASPHKSPYDDRQGWVTLEPIAWSSSQIQKWEPNPRPTFPPPNEAANYWNGGPSSSKPPYNSVSSERPWNKPSYEYNSKPQQWGGNKWNSNQNYEYKPTYSPGSWGGNSDIITDNRPGSFPPDSKPLSGGYRPWGSEYQAGQSSNTYNSKPTYSYGNSGNYVSSSERPASNNYSPSADGDGHWVLLSSTKGYSIPQRHRSNSRSMNLKELTESDLIKRYPKTITANIVNS